MAVLIPKKSNFVELNVTFVIITGLLKEKKRDFLSLLIFEILT